MFGQNFFFGYYLILLGKLWGRLSSGVLLKKRDKGVEAVEISKQEQHIRTNLI